MTEHIEREYECDFTGRDIVDTFGMLTVELKHPRGYHTIPRTGRDGQTIHIHPEEHAIASGNMEAGEMDVTAYVTDAGHVALFEVSVGPSTSHYGAHDGPDVWRRLADRINTEVLDD